MPDEQVKSDEQANFEAFMQTRAQAAEAYVNGDPKPLETLCAGSDPVSFFHPRGDVEVGAGPVLKRYIGDAASFGPGGETRLEILHLAAHDGLAYWVGYQHAQARLPGQDGPVAMKLRITELFRREGESWKLIHRHADMPRA